MDGWIAKTKHGEWWLMKMKIVLQNQTYNNCKDI